MAMSKRDYQTVAAGFCEAYIAADNEIEEAGIDVALEHVASALVSTNSRFDKERFVAAASECRSSGRL